MNSVQEFIAEQRPTQKQIMSVLRGWILDLGPHTTEKISYKVPCFYFYGPLCKLKPTADGVDLGFTQGASLSRDHKLVEKRGQKNAGSIRFHSLAELEEREEELRAILNEAAILNQYLFNQKKKKK
jgi:uncharacterized protein YdhG (YjbR/CyaY superfamily)